MATSKYTTRDALSAILSGAITEDTLEWARKEIEALDARNAKAKEKAAEKREADLPMLNSIMEALPLSADEPITAAELAEMVGISTA